MNFHLTQKISTRGYFSINVLDAEGNDTGKKIEDTPNVVTHIGGRMSRRYDYWDYDISDMHKDFYLGVGEGSIERTVDSVGLHTELALDRGSCTDGDGTGPTDNMDNTETFKKVSVGSFPLGAVEGTISEVGMFRRATGDTLIAGQLIKDGGGSPTTITVLADEQLVVTYTIEWTYSTDVISETSGTIDVNGVTTTWTLQVPPVKSGIYFKYPSMDRASYSFADNAYLLAGDDTVINSKAKGQETLANLSTGGTRYTMEGSWAPAEGMGDVAAILLSSDGGKSVLDKNCNSRINFDPPIPKTDSEVLTIEVSWDLVVV